MFNSRVPSPLYPSSSCQSYPPTSHSLSIPATVPPLPTGGCQFILLHPSVPDQRCSCQGFRRHDSLPGAHCQCGHQACYHSHEMVPQPDTECTSASCMALMDRIRRLEARYEYERNVWQEELKEERRARREDVRILREAMYSFYKFMEQDIPRKFEYVEDKIEGVVDRQQQLQERVMTVDDSTMALEDRVADLEDERRDSNGREEDDENKEVCDGVKVQSGNEMTNLEVPPSPLQAVKRKRHGIDHERADSVIQSRPSFTLPSPPPLSLSSPEQGPARCHVRETCREHSVASYSSLGLTS